MSHTISLTDTSYLAVTATISAGILSGCDYCTPALVALLTIPVVNLLINHIIKSQQSTLNRLYGFKESAS
jgi:hypothetical protein